MQNSYLNQIYDLFKSVETSGNLDDLFKLFTLMKLLVGLNMKPLYEEILSDSNYMSTFSILEYKPGIKSNSDRLHFREFLSSAKMLTIAPIQDEDIKKKIDFIYRLEYLRDTAAGIWIDEYTASFITVIASNTRQIVQEYLTSSKDITNILINKISSDDITLKYDAAVFLSDICQSAKRIYNSSKEIFFTNIISQGIIRHLLHILTQRPEGNDIISYYTVSQQQLTLTHAAEILGSIFFICPDKFKEYMVSPEQTDNNYPLLKELANCVVSIDNIAIKVEIVDLLKAFIDPEIAYLKEKIESLFYSHCLKQLADYLPMPTPKDLQEKEISCETKSLILDLIYYCLRVHTYRIRYFITQNDLFKSIVPLLKSNEKHLRLSVLRIYKAAIIKKDDFIYKYISTHMLFRPVIAELFKNIKRKNMIYSAIIDIFNYISTEKIIILINYLCSEHSKDLSNPILSSILPPLKPNFGTSTNKLTSKNLSKREAEQLEDEDYFERDNSDDESPLKKKEIESNDSIIEAANIKRLYNNYSSETNIDNELLERYKKAKNEE